jgi:two-component system, sensor histidine kinase LadS
MDTEARSVRNAGRPERAGPGAYVGAVVMAGAGAAGIACRDALRRLAVPRVGIVFRALALLAGLCLPMRVAAHCGIPDDWTHLDLAPRLAVLRDPGGAMTVDAARAAFDEGRFVPNREPIPAFGYTRDAIWLHVPIPPCVAQAEKLAVEIRSSRLDFVDWYVVRNGQVSEHAAMGILQVLPTGLRTRYPMLTLSAHAGETAELFVRVQSVLTLALPVTVWKADACASMASRREAGEGLYFGYLLALVVTGLVFAGFARDRGYLIYSLAAGSIAMLYFCHGGLYAAAGLPFPAYWSRNGVLLLYEAASTGMVLFTRSFFSLRQDYPRTDGFLKALAWAGAVIMLYCAFAPVQIPLITFLQIKSLLVGIGLTIPAAILYLRKVRVARFYLMAWVVFWVVVVWDLLQMHGLAPTLWMSGQGTRYSFAVSYTLFLVAMADRILENRREMERAQALALDLQRQANATLETKVAERTRELERAVQAAEAANQAKTRFFSHLSHDLRAPLNSLVGLSQSLWLECSDHSLPEEFITFLHQIHDSGLYLHQMMDNILDLTAIEAGKDAARVTTFPLQEWYHRNRDLVTPLTRRAGPASEWTYQGSPDRVFRGDPVKMSQILLNLALNAVKFTPAGKTVSVTLREGPEGVELAVADAGPGIPVAERERLFDHFDALPHDAWLPSQGVGLGLHVVRRYTDMLGGTVRVEHRPAGGTLFTVALPEAPVP